MDNKRQKIMLVDDNKASLAMGKSMLDGHYDVFALPSASKMFEFLSRVTPDLILLDIEMPGMNGYEAMTILKGDRQYADIPVIFLTSKTTESNEYEGLSLGAIDYVTKPFSASLFLKRIENHLLIVRQQARLKEFNDDLIKMVEKKTDQVFGIQNAIISTVADLIEFRDNSTGWHISRTEKYLESLINQLTHDEIYMDDILSWNMDIVLPSAQLHDVGKISISDAILNKPDKLTAEEFTIMKTHAQRGVEVIENMERCGCFDDYLKHAKIFAGTHHEKWDGSGYPNGLSGQNIPLLGRLMAIADVYDALISARPYKNTLPPDEAAQIVIEGAGSHFDPALIDTFKKVSGAFAETAKRYGAIH